MYDAIIDSWFQVFPPHMFCILSNNYLMSNHSTALDRVSAFIGLKAYDWSRFEVVANKKSSNARETPEVASDVPIAKTLVARLQALYASRGTQHYDRVTRDGWMGCASNKQ